MFPKLKHGDRVRFVSPASTPDRGSVVQRAQRLEKTGLTVEFGRHAFDQHGWFAGTDADRLADVNEAFADPGIRAVLATRGGRGSYRIADRLAFDNIRRDPKPLIGFSDITAMHLCLWSRAGVGGIHGALYGDGAGGLEPENFGILTRLLMQDGEMTYVSRPEEATSVLTTQGHAAGTLIGGNLETLATTVGWGLLALDDVILLLEAVDCTPGLTDRTLTLLIKGGHLRRLAGIAIGQFTVKSPEKAERIVSLLGEDLNELGVPVVGGLPFGHGQRALSVPLGCPARLDATSGTLTVAY